MRVAVDFQHGDRSHRKGDEVADDDPLILLAPHLFTLPEVADPVPSKTVRIRGPLTTPPRKGNQKE